MATAAWLSITVLFNRIVGPWFHHPHYAAALLVARFCGGSTLPHGQLFVANIHRWIIAWSLGDRGRRAETWHDIVRGRSNKTFHRQTGNRCGPPSNHGLRGTGQLVARFLQQLRSN